jgi:hypothetical protein
MARKDGDYKVGRSRPPEAHKYKPGQSGNLRGRPKGSKNLKTIIEQMLRQPVTVRDKSGKPHKLTTMEATVLRMRGLALGIRPADKPLDKLEFAAMTTVVEWASRFGPRDSDQVQKPEVQHSDILDSYVKRKSRPPEGEGNA